MDLDSLIDFANEATETIAKHKVSVILSPKHILAEDYAIAALSWDSIDYGEDEIEKVPADKRGIYAFVVCKNNDVLPSHGYVLYIGIAGRDSERPLRARYKDYLNAKTVRKRAGIARMIGTWHSVLRFFFAPIDDNVPSDDLKEIEKQLNTALMPPFSKGDLEADIRQQRRAFS